MVHIFTIIPINIEYFSMKVVKTKKESKTVLHINDLQRKKI